MTPTPTPELVPPGSRSENLLMAGKLLLDLASTPLHMLAFLFTKAGHRRRLMDALRAGR